MLFILSALLFGTCFTANAIPVPLGGPPQIAISSPCSCKNNAVSSFDGQFEETVRIQSVSGKTWTLSANAGFYDMLSPAPPAMPVLIPVGTVFVENPVGSGFYYLSGVHVDAKGFAITAKSESGEILSIADTCYYPELSLVNPGGPFCLNSPDLKLSALALHNPAATNAFFTINGNNLPASFNQQKKQWEASYDINALGAYQLKFTLDAGTAGSNQVADPGCVQSTDVQYFNVVETSSALSCNDLVNLSLDADCQEWLGSALCLQGAYDCYDDYKVEIDRTLPLGNGPWETALMNIADIGHTYSFQVTHLPSGNHCWGNVKIEDKLPPVLVCSDFSVPCNTDNLSPDYLVDVMGIMEAQPQAPDCQQVTYSTLDFNVTLGCATGLTGMVYRKWMATDASGNNKNCLQVISLLRPTLADVVLPPDYDGIDAPAFHCEDALPLVNGRPNPSPEWLEMNGFQGFPHVFGKADGCSINWEYQDYPIEVCDGTIKYRRDWTVVDACAGDGFIQHQILKVIDDKGPEMQCPANMTVSSDPNGCCAVVDLPDLILSDYCSRINNIGGMIEVREEYTDNTLNMWTLNGALTDFPGNNWWAPDTLGKWDNTPCLPLGRHTVTYMVEDDCGNTSSCQFELRVIDLAPPIATCATATIVTLGPDDPNDCYAVSGDCTYGGVAWVSASVFNDGSYDNCKPIKMTIRRMEPYTSCIALQNDQPCYSNEDGDLLFSEAEIATMEQDSIKFYCCEAGATQTVILRVYQMEPDGSFSPGPDQDLFYSECMVQVTVQDKAKPICVSPANVTVNCENFDPTLETYGIPSVSDNCCLDESKIYGGQCGLTHSANYSLFDTVCNKGTITRTFRVFDCHGQSSQCTQRIVVEYRQRYFIKFPNDGIVNICDTKRDYGVPEFSNEDCELMGLSYTDEIFTVVPDACFKIERTWNIINWCTFNPNHPLIEVPNPTPSSISNAPINLPGPTVSECGTLPPWAPTSVKINPNDPQPTNYCTFWDANANGYTYKQIIKVSDLKPPSGTYTVPGCDNQAWNTTNDPALWNEPYWWNNGLQTHNLCEEPVELCITATDACSGSDVRVSYQLFLDLDGDGVMETVVNSNNTGLAGLGWNNVLYDNLNTPNYEGGTPRSFDERPVPENEKYGFAVQESVLGDNKIVCARFNTRKQPGNFLPLQLPHGSHKIKWFIADGCGNDKVYEYPVEVKDCKVPTVVCINGLSANLMPTGMVTLWASDFLQYAEDNCTPAGQIKIGIRKCGTGTGFPLNADGAPQLSVTFTCTELGAQCIELWAMDAAGNADHCETNLLVQDNNGNCNAAGDKISVWGELKTETSDGVEQATVHVDGTAFPGISFAYFDDSNANGSYAVTNGLPVLSDISIRPEKEDNPLNGVTTYDLVLMSKHILGISPLNSPYKMIAADVNKSGSITTFDIVELRKLILGIYNELPSNSSWRFIDREYNFPNPYNPFQSSFPETIAAQQVITNQGDKNFVAVKVGDLNNSVVPNLEAQSLDRNQGTAIFDVEDRNVTEGSVFEVSFKSTEMLNGFQFTLALMGLKAVAVVESANVRAENFNLSSDGAVAVSIDGAQEFTLRFQAEKSGRLSEMLQLSSQITRAQAYGEKGLMEPALRFDGKSVSFRKLELYQNQPNPFTNQTAISFYLPKAGAITLSIFDVEGRLIYRQQGEFDSGEHTLSLNKLQGVPGEWYCELQWGGEVAVRKMLKKQP